MDPCPVELMEKGAREQQIQGDQYTIQRGGGKRARRGGGAIQREADKGGQESGERKGNRADGSLG
jgi:hypothetical protein